MRRSKADVERYIASVQGSIPSPREVSGSWRAGRPPPWPCRGPAQRRRHGSWRPPLPGALRRRPAPAVRWAAWRSRARGRGGGGRPRQAAVGASSSSFSWPAPDGPYSRAHPVPGFLGCVGAASSPGLRSLPFAAGFLLVSRTVYRCGGSGTFQALEVDGTQRGTDAAPGWAFTAVTVTGNHHRHPADRCRGSHTYNSLTDRANDTGRPPYFEASVVRL